MALNQVLNQVAADRLHPGDVAANRRHLTVVGDRPEWLGSPPCRGRVRAIPAVEENISRSHVWILEVWVKLADLGQSGQSFVHDRPVGETRDREIVSGEVVDDFVQ